MALFQQSENEHTIEALVWTDGDGADTYRYGLDPRLGERRVDLIAGANSDTAPHTIDVQVVDPNNNSFHLFWFVVPAGAGFGQPLASAIPPVLVSGLSGIVFPSRWTLRVGLLGTMPSGKIVSVLAFGGA